MNAAFTGPSPRYTHSFLYLLRASHGQDGSLGLKYTTQNVTAIIGYRNNIVYITPLTDKEQGKGLEILCNEIMQKTGCRIFLKKVLLDQFPKIALTKPNKVTDTELEDAACSETIINLTKLFITPEGTVNRKAKRFFRKVKRFKKLNIHLDISEDLTQIPLNKVENFLKKDERKFASFHPIVTYLYHHGPDNRYEITIFLYKGLVQALYIIEKFSPTEAGLYCGVTAKDKPGITEWMDHHVFQEMFFEGIKTVYLGGSENPGINYFVKKLLPEKPPYSVDTFEYQTTK